MVLFWPKGPMRHGTRQLSGKRARHGAGHRRVAGFYSAAWPDIAPPLTDANGHTLDILVQTRRNARAARRFLARLIAQFGQPRVMITDKLRSYFKPIRNLAPDADHRAHKGLNNLVEGSHRPTRRREKIMGRFKSQRQAQRFLAAHDQINTLFRPRRYRLTASSYRHARADAFSLWNDYALEMNA